MLKEAFFQPPLHHIIIDNNLTAVGVIEQIDKEKDWCNQKQSIPKLITNQWR